MVQFYSKCYPAKGDLLVCRIDSIQNDSGYMVELLEYDNIMGFVGLKEITQAKWFRNLRGMASEGDVEVMQVIAVGDKGEVDLSRRYISEEAKTDILSKYKLWKRVYDYLLYMVSSDLRDLIIEQILHPYLEHVESMNGEEDDENNEDEEQEQEQQQQQQQQEERKKEPERISSWIEKQKVLDALQTMEDINNMQDILQQIIFHVVSLVEKPVDNKIQNGTVQLRAISRLNVEKVNQLLQTLANQFNVNIKTYNTKNATFQVVSKEKMTVEQFNDTLRDMVNELQNLVSTNPELPSETVNSVNGGQKHEEQQQQPQQPLLNIGIVGHVAHGKTTLIEAISGVDTRKYKKEISTNRTLNIGYTNATVCKCVCNGTPMYLAQKDTPRDCACDNVTVSIVDCPGHNVLLSTMITGAQIMDTCVLVVSADEPCPQPQTNEHVAVLQIIGKTQSHFSDGLILQNKVDLVSTTRAKESHSEISDFISGTVLQGLNIIPISAQMRINTENVLKFIYEYTTNKLNQCGTPSCIEEVQETERRHSKGIISKNF